MNEQSVYHKLDQTILKYINSNSLYNVILTFLWMSMFCVPMPVNVIATICSFLHKRLLRIGIPVVFAILYIVLNYNYLILIIFFLMMFAIGMCMMEYRKHTTALRNDYNSLLLILFSMVTLSIIDFTQSEVLYGLSITYTSASFPICLYRVFSVFLIFEFVKIINLGVKSTKVSGLIGFNVFFILGAVNYWTMSITNKEFLLSDIFLAKTVMGVLSNVQITTDDIWQFAWYLVLVIMFNVIWCLFRFSKTTKKERLKTGINALLWFIVIILVIQSGAFRTYSYRGTINMGLPAHLIANAKGLVEPSGYDEYVEQMGLEKEVDLESDLCNSDGPNIIVIMSEAFSDLQMVDDFETNEDYIPFIRKLLNEYPSGTLYSSVFGNNTVSSEYEFLTGVPTGLTDKGGTIYQRHMKEKEESIVSLLQGQGYYTAGLHSYNGMGYNRLHAWQCFGFDEVHFEEDFKDVTYVRDYISDQSFYEKIIEIYENKSEQPLFCFGISMQNHATYLTDYMGDVSLTDMKYEDVDEYLSLLKETDKATQDLIEYFSQVDEDTMIVFFGDHQPMVNEKFYSELVGTDYYEFTLEQSVDTYKIPYFIWTNYETDIVVPEEMSINYLPNVVLDAAGLQKNSWFSFTDEVFAQYPIITDNFIKINNLFIEKKEVIDALNKIESPDEADMWHLLKEYQIWSYFKAIDN